jgi:crotonobetaine/carnitine-CoA ligase
MGSSIDQVLVWFALNRLGAINVPINTALEGAFLEGCLRMIRPSALVFDADRASTLGDVLQPAGCSSIHQYVHSTESMGASGLPPLSRSLNDLLARDEVADIDAEMDRLSTATMLFTSGSTGVPKACALSHHYLLRQAQIHVKYLGLTEDDVLYTPFPLFHIDGATLTVGAALVAGATAALSERFSASRFWDEIRIHGATVFNFMGATANILWKLPPQPTDRAHRVRLAWGVPMPACEPEWETRFGFPLVELYGLTDAGLPAYQPLNERRRPGSCGRVIDEYTVRIGDETGESVEVGEIGEILIRSEETGLVMNEYFAMPRATSNALRGGWFHTGDLGRLDEDGYLYFVSRGKEVIRRRGENIAATDVENGINSHPDVKESAAVATPSELSEDDIRAFIVLQPNASATEAELADHCRRALPAHMVPRYIELVSHLPKTPTEKIERVKLASLPISDRTWDVERALARRAR